MGLVLLGASALALFCACHLSRRINYYTKFSLYIVGSLFAGTLFIPIMFLKPFDPRNGLMPAWFLRVWIRLMGITYEIRGHENIVKDTGAVVLMNHQSILDLNILAYIWPVTPGGCVVSKNEIFWLWPFGLGAWLWGTVFIDRLNPDKAQKDINKAGSHISTQKARICMFPEGTRHRGSELLPLKKGAFHIALAAKCPIQPVVINNYHFLDDKTYKFDCGHSYINFLPAISTEGLTKDDLPALVDKVYAAMNEGYQKINERVIW